MRHKTSLALLSSAILLAGCGSGASTSATHAKAPAATSSSTKVTIAGYAFHPGTITVPAGAKVTFTNHDKTAHTATSTASRFDTGTLAPGASHSVVLRTPGRYTYYCQYHAFMRGIIVVR